MIFMGDIISGPRCFAQTASALAVTDRLCLKDGILDSVYLTKDTVSPFTGSLPSSWDFNTILYALFRDNLYAGNIDFTASMITHLRIKRRKAGETDWLTLYDHPVSSNEDLAFVIHDPYARSGAAGQKYEYAIVPCQNKTEGNQTINTVLSQFDGFFIVEKDLAYQAILNASLSTELVRENAVVKTLGRKYPVIVQNGTNGYMQGALTCTFIPFDERAQDYDPLNGTAYREQVHAFLNNKHPKILKSNDGRMWMVMLTDSITIDESQHIQMPVEQIHFIETGDPENGYDLYYNNFIDINIVPRKDTTFY